MSKPAIALFARAPAPGQVKTRLIGRLTPEQACDLHRAFVADAWEMLQECGPPAEIFLFTDLDHPEWRRLAGPALRLQQGADLGRKMLHCFEELREAGFGPLLILGSDSPALSAEMLTPWSSLLAEASAVVGPAEDGGYYAIGCRAPHPQMFDGVEWSSPQTLVRTVLALERCGMPPAFLARHYDVDTPEALDRLRAEANLPRHTCEWLRRNT